MQIKIWDATQRQWVIGKPKVYKDGSWVDATCKLYEGSSWNAQTVYKYPNYSDKPQEVEYAWGYHTLTTDAQREAYCRLINAWIYSDKLGSYYYRNINDGSLYLVSDIVGTYLTSVGLKVYLNDCALSITSYNTVFNAVRQDMVGGIYKFYFDEVDVTSYYSLSNSYINYAYLPYYQWSDQKSMLANMMEAANDIEYLVKYHHNIDFTDKKFTEQLVNFTSEEKKLIVKVIHDYLVRHNIYGSSTTPRTGNQIAWSALSNHVTEPVCAGYARAFSHLCSIWGITSLIVPGYVSSEGDSGNHMWNEVSYGQKKPSECTLPSDWSEMDVTWDDPTFSGQDDSQHTTPYPDYVRWKYFNVTTEFIAGDTNNTAHLRRPPASGGGNRLVESWPSNTSTNTDYNYGYDADLGYSNWVIWSGDNNGNAKAYAW